MRVDVCVRVAVSEPVGEPDTEVLPVRVPVGEPDTEVLAVPDEDRDEVGEAETLRLGEDELLGEAELLSVLLGLPVPD